MPDLMRHVWRIRPRLLCSGSVTQHHFLRVRYLRDCYHTLPLFGARTGKDGRKSNSGPGVLARRRWYHKAIHDETPTWYEWQPNKNNLYHDTFPHTLVMFCLEKVGADGRSNGPLIVWNPSMWHHNSPLDPFPPVWSDSTTQTEWTLKFRYCTQLYFTNAHDFGARSARGSSKKQWVPWAIPAHTPLPLGLRLLRCSFQSWIIVPAPGNHRWIQMRDAFCKAFCVKMSDGALPRRPDGLQMIYPHTENLIQLPDDHFYFHTTPVILKGFVPDTLLKNLENADPFIFGLCSLSFSIDGMMRPSMWREYNPNYKSGVKSLLWGDLFQISHEKLANTVLVKQASLSNGEIVKESLYEIPGGTLLPDGLVMVRKMPNLYKLEPSRPMHIKDFLRLVFELLKQVCPHPMTFDELSLMKHEGDDDNNAGYSYIDLIQPKRASNHGPSTSADTLLTINRMGVRKRQPSILATEILDTDDLGKKFHGSYRPILPAIGREKGESFRSLPLSTSFSNFRDRDTKPKRNTSEASLPKSRWKKTQREGKVPEEGTILAIPAHLNMKLDWASDRSRVEEMAEYEDQEHQMPKMIKGGLYATSLSSGEKPQSQPSSSVPLRSQTSASEGTHSDGHSKLLGQNPSDPRQKQSQLIRDLRESSIQSRRHGAFREPSTTWRQQTDTYVGIVDHVQRMQENGLVESKAWIDVLERTNAEWTAETVPTKICLNTASSSMPSLTSTSISTSTSTTDVALTMTGPAAKDSKAETMILLSKDLQKAENKPATGESPTSSVLGWLKKLV